MGITDIDMIKWLHSVGVYDYDICDGVVHVVGDVNISGLGLTSIPVQFGYVSGYFSCGGNQLESLKGCPKEVSGEFSCYGNELSSLEGGPKEVGGDFDCYSNLFKDKPDTSGIKIGGKFVWE